MTHERVRLMAGENGKYHFHWGHRRHCVFPQCPLQFVNHRAILKTTSDGGVERRGGRGDAFVARRVLVKTNIHE